jgi:hypothetical protein
MRVVTFGFFIVLVLATAFVASPASALTAKEADSVVTILEKLKADDVQIAYDADAADDLFEQDADEKKFITQAGFNQKTWKTAIDQTMKGFFASIPEAEITAIFEGLRKRLDAASDMTAEQKQAMRGFWDEQRQQMIALRQEGQPFAAIVTPYAARLRKLTFD